MRTGSAHLRLIRDGTLEVEKFTSNIVVDDHEHDLQAWDEDHWWESILGREPLPCDKKRGGCSSGNTTTSDSNCIRCTFLNVGYETGKLKTAQKGEVLKSLPGDRQIDVRKTLGPVFGRYGFLPDDSGQGLRVGVGGTVHVSKCNSTLTIWRYPEDCITSADNLP